MQRVINFYSKDRLKWAFIEVSSYITINVPESIFGIESINDSNKYRLVHDKQLLESMGLVKDIDITDDQISFNFFDGNTKKLKLISKFVISNSDKSFMYIEELKNKPGIYKLYGTSDLFDFTKLSKIEITRND